MDSECKSRDVLQSYFDLLGELMKFNVDAFKRFNKYINTDAKVGSPRALCNWLQHPLAVNFGLPIFRGGHAAGRDWDPSGGPVFCKHSLYLLCLGLRARP